jgi:plasmid stabilization system protein ParE
MTKVVVRVRMEPELEEIAGHLDPRERVEMAQKLARWVRQLQVSAHVLSQPPSARPRRLPRLRPSELGRN